MRASPLDASGGLLRSPTSHQFAGASFWSFFLLRATASSDRTLLTWQPFDQGAVSWTYGQVLREASSLAAGMQSRGIATGDRVLIHLDNCPEQLFAWLACLAIGAVPVTTNTRSSLDELQYYAHDAQVVAAVTQPRLLELVGKAAPAVGWIACTDHDSGVPATAAGLPSQQASYRALLADADALVPALPDPLAPATIQYTSGTTARPKGAVWNHANLLWSAKTNAANLSLRPTDVLLIYTPMFHANATTFGMLPSMWVGCSFVLTPKWSTSRFWDISLRHRCTWTSLIGLSVRALLDMPSPSDHAYRLFGGGISIDEFPGCGVKTIGWWGMTELGAAGIIGDAFLPNRALSVGRPTPGYGIAMVREDGSPVDVEEPGDLVVQGTPGLSLFAGYLGRPEETAACYDEQGWFRTGDRLVPHADGQISFVERAKDMLKVGAENLAAVEVERVILEVPGVVEAAVVGRPDVALDEVPVAFVLAKDPAPDLADRIMAQCRRGLADFKVPRVVYVVPELPRSTMTKVNKAELRRFAAPGDDRDQAARRWVDEALRDPSGEAR